ncbi:hypothetical protein WICPIJ_000678 [Wickerhamomyces pijperi]|uniref:Uncharacterized protein n=1 Tax=Wickerhamomyces pijperi TaxID=599730 RepID=A0A9P8TRL6_WICPI|nr:hypothetical protein WICPIJ_000678 [Wickerhamomyces pijperi]
MLVLVMILPPPKFLKALLFILTHCRRLQASLICPGVKGLDSSSGPSNNLFLFLESEPSVALLPLESPVLLSVPWLPFSLAAELPLCNLLKASSSFLTIKAFSVKEQTISKVKNPKISITSSPGLADPWPEPEPPPPLVSPLFKLLNPAQSRNLLAFLKVKLACLHSDQCTYSSFVIFLVRSSAAFNLFKEAKDASLSASSVMLSSSAGSSNACSEKRNWSSHGNLILDFFIFEERSGLTAVPALGPFLD